MSLQDWERNGWLLQHKATAQDIAQLLFVVERDIRSAGAVDSSDWTFNIAYNAALKLATVLLYAEGYRADKMNNHYRTFQAIPVLLGSEHRPMSAYLNKCRQKRNEATYDRVGVVSRMESQELLDFIPDFQAQVSAWLEEHHPAVARDVENELDTLRKTRE